MLLPAGNNMQGQQGGGHTAPPQTLGLPGPGASPGTSAFSQFETPRRTQTIGRVSEDLQGHSGGHGAHQQMQSPHHAYNSSNDFSSTTAPGISLQQATPQSAHFSNPNQASTVPSSLQPGSSSRPGPSSAYTAPTTVPTIPQINTNAQQYTLPTRSNTMSTSSHNYSRSSPAGLDQQKYVPFSHSETPKYPPTPNQKFPAYGPYSPQTPGGSAQSPLALEHIRPRAESGADESVGRGTLWNDMDRTPTNSNYLAPWAIFAYDWCKWPVHGAASAGKMAIGSYLEDPHNFVSVCGPDLHRRRVVVCPAYEVLQLTLAGTDSNP